MKSYLILIIVLIFISSSSEMQRNKGKKIPVPDLNGNSVQNTNENLIDPLAIHIALGQTQQQKTGNIITYKLVLFAKNIKAFFKSMYQGYIANLLKFNINPKKVYDVKKKKFVKNIKNLKKIKCKDPHSVIFGGQYLASLYQEIYNIDNNNLKTKPMNIIRILLKIILETGNYCTNLLDYYHYFKDEIHTFEYLKTTSHSSKFNNPGLLLQTSSSKNHFLASWGKFDKMGEFIGHIISWYRIYKPPSEVQKQAQQIATLLKLLKSVKNENNETKSKKKLKRRR